MIAYKVVRREDGKYVSALNLNPPTLKQCERNKIPSRVYRIGYATKALKRSMGIFCFDTLANAELFTHMTRDTILEVSGLGEPTKPEIIDTTIYPRFNIPEDNRGRNWWDGVICFLEVTVIRKVNEPTN